MSRGDRPKSRYRTSVAVSGERENEKQVGVTFGVGVRSEHNSVVLCGRETWCRNKIRVDRPNSMLRVSTTTQGCNVTFL